MRTPRETIEDIIFLKYRKTLRALAWKRLLLAVVLIVAQFGDKGFMLLEKPVIFKQENSSKLCFGVIQQYAQRHSRESGNPDAVPAKAGNHKGNRFPFTWETLDSASSAE